MIHLRINVSFIPLETVRENYNPHQSGFFNGYPIQSGVLPYNT